MAETTTTNAIETKKVIDLEEKTTPADADLFMAGDSGTASLKKFKWSSLIAAIKTKLAAWTFDTLTTTNKTLPGALNELNSKTAEVKASSPWTYIEYKNGLLHAWRYATISSGSGAKTNTISLPTPMKDAEYSVIVFPIFNGHLCHSVWAGTLTGADGRTTTTAQVSMDSVDSNSNVGVMIHVMGYRA